MARRDVTISIAVIVLLALIVTATATFNHSQKTASVSAQSSQVQSSTSSSTQTSGSSSSSSYKDGTYTTTGSYTSPGGDEAITVSVTLKNGIITATSAQNGATDGEGKEYQDEFISGYPSLVVGKSIDSVSLSRVSGSSLTSSGFNAALEKIKTDAKA